MDDTERVSQAINGWIHEYREWLKDGSRGGLHPRAKDALIKTLVQVISDVRGSMPPAVMRPHAKAGMVPAAEVSEPAVPEKSKPSKPRTLKQKAKDDAEARG